jgi:adenine-specific DNA methylase
MKCPRLIEVALPIREISAESVREKSLRHGHISTLHLWWARRPLAAARAVVFASLVPDPDDPDCPPAFRAAVLRMLKEKVPDELKGYSRGRKFHRDPDPYMPYKDIPDTARNRLLTFIARWSPDTISFESGASEEKPSPSHLLDDRCLVKWETSDPGNGTGREVLRIARELVKVANDGKPPTVLDPFSGGGAIPLEAGRVGAQAIANDYNPVAALVLRATCEFAQRHGKSGIRAIDGHLQGQGHVGNVLVHDVERWAHWILDHARQRIGHLFPPGKDKLPIVGYIWARTAPCSNPACRAEIPLLRSMIVCEKPGKRVALTISIKGKTSSFGIAVNKDIARTEGTMLNRGDCRCPFCNQTTPVKDLRKAGLENKLGERLVGVITERENGKDYRMVEPTDLAAFETAKRIASSLEKPREPILPEITSSEDDAVSNSTGIRVHLYGMKTWGSLFNCRQLVVMQTLVNALGEALTEMRKETHDAEYEKTVAAYLGLWVSRISMFETTVGLWKASGEFVASPFSMQKISMEWDYAETCAFSEATGGALSQLDWILRTIVHESAGQTQAVLPARVLCGDGAKLALERESLEAVTTDPPYFDAISYADLSDFFYVWLKRGVGDVFPELFATPLTPKADEATALKHRHGGSARLAEQHFRSKLSGCFAEARRVCKRDGVVAIMFAHQTTEAWTALIEAIFEAGLNITASYPIDTERGNRPRGIDSSALASSITVVCRPRLVGAATAFREVRKEIERVVQESVHRFWEYGFRGADLIVACYGPAVGVFGKYERVEKGDGTPVDVPTLLALVRESALKAIAGEFTGDMLSRLYFVWANLYGIGEQAWDDARMVVQIGAASENAMEVARGRGLFVVNGSSCRLALLRDRSNRRHLGEEDESPLIDQLHHAMILWKNEDRTGLVEYLQDRELAEDVPFWKLAQALFEVLSHNEEDWKLVSALLGERETLRVETRKSGRTTQPKERGLFD